MTGHDRTIRAVPGRQKAIPHRDEQTGFVVECSCGWTRLSYRTYRDAASAHGMHAAAARRREAKEAK